VVCGVRPAVDDAPARVHGPPQDRPLAGVSASASVPTCCRCLHSRGLMLSRGWALILIGPVGQNLSHLGEVQCSGLGSPCLPR